MILDPPTTGYTLKISTLFLCLTTRAESLLCRVRVAAAAAILYVCECVRAVFFKVQIQVVLCVQSIYRLESTVLHLLVERRPTRCPASRWSVHHCTHNTPNPCIYYFYTARGCISFTHIHKYTNTCVCVPIYVYIATLNIDPRQSKQKGWTWKNLYIFDEFFRNQLHGHFNFNITEWGLSIARWVCFIVVLFLYYSIFGRWPNFYDTWIVIK